MNLVVGLDVAKGESQVQAFLDKSKPFGKSYSMKHTREELNHFIGFLKEIELMTGQIPMVILESTGHYHFPVIQYLEEQEVLYILLNPIISYQTKSSSLRKVKKTQLTRISCACFITKMILNLIKTEEFNY